LGEVSHAKTECNNEENISDPGYNVPKAESTPGDKHQELVELEKGDSLREGKENKI